MPQLGSQVVARIAAHLEANGWKSLGQMRDARATIERIVDEEHALFLASQKPPRKKRGPTTAFTPPTPAEVEGYAKEIGYDLGPEGGEGWCDHYETKGWKTSGSTRMTSWKAAVRNWKRNGWRVGSFGGQNSAPQKASLGALQFQLGKVEKELTDILRPGGCATNRMPQGEKLVRYNELMDQRRGLIERIDGFSGE